MTQEQLLEKLQAAGVPGWFEISGNMIGWFYRISSNEHNPNLTDVYGNLVGPDDVARHTIESLVSSNVKISATGQSNTDMWIFISLKKDLW